MRELRILRVHGDHPMLFSRHGNLPNPRQQARFFHLWRNIRRPRHTHVAASPPRKARQHRIRLRPYRDRLDEQRAYFGITREQAVAIAHESAAFTSKRLAAPFTVLTRWRSALGRSALGRVYCIVITAEGRDLNELLVENGWRAATESARRCRTAGIRRKILHGSRSWKRRRRRRSAALGGFPSDFPPGNPLLAVRGPLLRLNAKHA